MSWVAKEYTDFTGGENKIYTPEKMLPNQLLLALNCVMTEDGLLETRLGKTKLNATTLGSGGITSIYRYAKESGTDYLVVQHSTNLYSTTWDGDSAITWGAAAKSSLNAAKLYGVVWKDNLILSNGVDNPFRWDGTTATDLGGTPPKLLYIKVYAGRLWGVDAANPNYVRFSDLEDYDVWPATNLIKVRDGDGDFITGLSPQEGGMVIVKNKSMWPMYGTNADNIELPGPFPQKTGCVAPDALIDEGLILAQDTLYQFSLNGLGPPINTHKPTISALTPAERASAFAVALPTKSRAVITFGNSGTLNLDSANQGVTTWSGLNAGCYSVCDAEGDDGSLLIGDADNGFVYKLDNTTDDDGADITTDIETAYLHHDTVKEKVWRYFQPTIEPVNETDILLYLKYDIDYSTSSGLFGLNKTSVNILDWGIDLWGDGVWGIGSKINDPYWLHEARGNRISFGTTSNDRIKFLGFETKYKQVGKK